METIEHRGYWWLPENPKNRIAGFLTFSPQSGAKLELIGTFNPQFNSVDRQPIILGQNAEGKLITLQNCHRTSYSLIDFSAEKSDYIAQLVFIGINVGNEEELKFIKTRIKYTYLYNWVGVTGISFNQFLEDGNTKYQTTYSSPGDISISTSQWKIEFGFGANIKTHYDASSFKENTSIYFEVFEEKSWFELFKTYVSPLQSLINLGTTKNNFIEECVLFHKDAADHGITVYFNQRFYDPKIKENLILNEMLFILGDIFENLEQRINNWIALSQELESVIQLFTKAKISPEIFLELKFLTIAQALETYHRTKRDSDFLPPDEFKNRINEVIAAIPIHHQEWVQAKLNNNDKSLLARIDELLKEKATVMEPIIESIDSFGKRTRDTRNYYTHYGKKKKKKAATGSNLHWLTEKLLILLQSCLMGEIGIAPEQQITLFQRYEYYNTLRNNKTAQ